MRMIRHVLGGTCALALLGAGFGGDAGLTTIVGTARAQTAKPASAAPPQTAGPRLQVDPLWPKPLPNHWLFGSITGVAVDSRNHIWVVHRGADSLNARTEMSAATNPPTAAECCHPAPAVLEFDEAGALVSHWGGPGDGYTWPRSPGGIAVDAQGNVWIAAAGVNDAPAAARGRGGADPAAAPRPVDAHVLKFTREGKFLLQIGKAGQPGNNDSTTGLYRPAAIAVDSAANEVYVADGFTNRRVVVFDATSGAYKRHWGAYGAPPVQAMADAYDPAAPPAKQFRTVGCVEISNDGLIYVCDRRNDRVQVFRKDGTFVKEGFISKTTTGEGSVWDVAFSSDPKQRFVFVADGQDQKVFVLDRETLAVVSSFGGGGRWPGGFYGVGSVAVDAKGNVYTGENFEGKRLQKFVNR
jgi:DNA-binding beta-propeller fold protein YncE